MTSAKSSGLRFMAAGWGIFTGSHLVMSHPPVREQLVQAAGDEGKFLGLYSLVAAGTFFPTTYVYLRYARGVGVIPGWTSLTRSNPGVRTLGVLTKVGAAVMFGQGVSTPDPALSRVHNKESGTNEGVEPKGIFRITRHPTFTALALLGVGNMLLRGYAGDLVYWAGYPLIWAVGCPHQDYRLKTTGIVPKEYYDKTSFLPFAAIAEGRGSLALAWAELNKPALATSVMVPLFFL